MGQTVYTNTQIPVLLEDTPLASAGGEGAVYRIKSRGSFATQNYCAKIYHPQKRTAAKKKKIEFMVQNKPHILLSANYIICYPSEILFDNARNFIGFLMPLAFSGSENLYELTRSQIHPKLQHYAGKFDRGKASGIENRLKACVNIAIAVHTIHQSGKYVIVDYKPQNILITGEGKISITDVDSFQISNNGIVLFHSEVATPEYAPPEAMRLNPAKNLVHESWDRFSLAVSFYEILFGIHPFTATCDGQYHGATTIGEKIQKGLFVHGSKKNYLTIIPPIHNNFHRLPPALQRLFITAFETGHTNNNARPTAEQWGKTIHAELTTKNGIKANTVSVPVKKISTYRPPTNKQTSQYSSNTKQVAQRSGRTFIKVMKRIGRFMIGIFLWIVIGFVIRFIIRGIILYMSGY